MLVTKMPWISIKAPMFRGKGATPTPSNLKAKSRHASKLFSSTIAHSALKSPELSQINNFSARMVIFLMDKQRSNYNRFVTKLLFTPSNLVKIDKASRSCQAMASSFQGSERGLQYRNNMINGSRFMEQHIPMIFLSYKYQKPRGPR